MTDPVAGLAEMARVTRSGGLVAACVRDHGGGTGPLSVFWDAVAALDPDAHDESGWPAPGKVIWQNCSSRPGCATWSRRCSRCTAGSAVSTNGGSR